MNVLASLSCLSFWDSAPSSHWGPLVHSISMGKLNDQALSGVCYVMNKWSLYMTWVRKERGEGSEPIPEETMVTPRISFAHTPDAARHLKAKCSSNKTACRSHRVQMQHSLDMPSSYPLLCVVNVMRYRAP